MESLKKTICRIVQIGTIIWVSSAGDRIIAQSNFPPPDPPPSVVAERTYENIQLDGRLDETAWSGVNSTSNFFRIEPRQGGEISFPTEVKLLFDEKNLYVGAVCLDSAGIKGIRVQDLRRDFSWGENDIFGIQLDPQNLKQFCVSFQTTPWGNQRDLQAFNDDFRDNDWNALWQVRTQRTDEGYTLEMAIPFKSIRYESLNGDSTVWGLTFTRLARREYEHTVFPAIPQSFSPYRMTYAAKLKGLELPPPATNLRVEPFGLVQNEREIQGNTRIGDASFRMGGDVKWAITPRTVLDMTVRTDFAQADVDRAVNNLERFNVFFPERRQFFLENSGIWAGAGDQAVVPFFSRKIGLRGDFNAEPALIDAGFRFTDRTEDRTIGALLIRQRGDDSSSGSNFGIFRYLKNYGKENNIGGMITHRLDDKEQFSGDKTKNNTTLTIDGLLRPRDELTISYYLSMSRDNNNDSLGVAGKFFAGYNANKFYAGWLSYLVSRDYEPGMGFVFQNNVIWHNPGGYWILRPKKLSWIRRLDPGIFINYYHNADRPGNFQQANLYIFPIYLFFKDGSFLEWAIFPTWQNINFEFAPLGINLEQKRYYYLTQYVLFKTDQSKKLAANFQYDWGGYYNGRRQALTAGMRLAPHPKITCTIEYEYNNLQFVGMDRQNLKTQLFTGGLRLAANPRLQLSVFYQYNSFDDTGRWNIRGSWEYKPLSFIYLVFNEQNQSSLDYARQSFISKLSYLRQF